MRPIDIVSICLIAFWVFVFIKNGVTYYMQEKIGDAILAYQLDRIRKGDIHGSDLVSVWDIERYEKTLFRFWDWGYTRILPPEKFELIKPFIK